LAPLIAHAQDLILILVNPFVRHDMPPKNARGILDRLNEIRLDEAHHGPEGARRFDYVPPYILRGLEAPHIEFTATP